jgi:hypothetical protein
MVIDGSRWLSTKTISPPRREPSRATESRRLFNLAPFFDSYRRSITIATITTTTSPAQMTEYFSTDVAIYGMTVKTIDFLIRKLADNQIKRELLSFLTKTK